MLEFAHHETLKEIRVAIIKKEEAQRDDLFLVRLFNPEGGAKLSKKDCCTVEIVQDDGSSAFS